MVARLAFVLAMVFPWAAFGQSACLPRSAMAQILDERYNEYLVAQAMQSNGLLFEIYSTEDGSTWTAVISSPEKSCVFNSGENWEAVKPAKPMSAPL